MDKKLDSRLVKKYPKIFRDRRASMRVTAMCWGFECGDGWYNIIDTLCKTIQSRIDYSRQRRIETLLYNRALIRASKGDFSSYNRLPEWTQKSIDVRLKDPEPQLKVVPNVCPQVVATQVKEKFGSLRFYYCGGDDVIDGMVSLAESLSSKTCGECGAPGVIREGGWLRSLCDEHADGRKEFKNSPF